jgi:hypothetical protein
VVVRFLILFFITASLMFDAPLMAQHKHKSSVRRTPHGGKDPFSSSRKPNKIHLDAGLSFSPKKYKAKSRRKGYSLGRSQSFNQREAHGRRASKGIAYNSNVAGDYFSKKSKKKTVGFGKRGESFYKKKRRMSLFKPHGGRETRRMDRVNKSFKKK